MAEITAAQLALAQVLKLGQEATERQARLEQLLAGVDVPAKASKPARQQVLPSMCFVGACEDLVVRTVKGAVAAYRHPLFGRVAACLAHAQALRPWQ